MDTSRVQTKIRNKLSPETTEKVVYVNSNSNTAATVRDADELNMFAWDNEDVEPRNASVITTPLCAAWPGQVKLKRSDQ